MLEYDIGFWQGMIAVGTATVIGVLVAWLLPPRKEAIEERERERLKREEQAT